MTPTDAAHSTPTFSCLPSPLHSPPCSPLSRPSPAAAYVTVTTVTQHYYLGTVTIIIPISIIALTSNESTFMPLSLSLLPNCQ